MIRNIDELLQDIKDTIRANGMRSISGDMLQGVLIDILETAYANGGGNKEFGVKVIEDGFFFVDESLNVGVRIDNDGLHAKNILEYEIVN